MFLVLQITSHLLNRTIDNNNFKQITIKKTKHLFVILLIINCQFLFVNSFAQFTKVLDFNGTNGSNPYINSSLMQASDGMLYGVTYTGGGVGVLFQYNPTLNIYTIKFNFDGIANGSYPSGSLMQASDGMLYGMAQGGANDASGGVLFQYDPINNIYIKKFDFDGATKGSNPNGTLMQASDGMLYGMTPNGGANNMGVLFKYNPATSFYTKMLDFAGVTNGNGPLGSLMQASDGMLYGMTFKGGTSTACSGGCGTLFRYCIPVLFTCSPTICDGQSLTVGTHTYTASNTYIDTLNSYRDCDSIVTTNLTVLPANTFSQTLSLCQGNSITVGAHTYTASNTYTDTLTSYTGCDSVVTTELTVNTVDTSATMSNNTITANATSATYLWINCNDNLVIAGQTNQSYTATANGSYAVIVTQNSCSDTSACYDITTTGSVENSFAGAISIYPNPVSNELIIEFFGNKNNSGFEIVNPIGQVVFKGNLLEKTIVQTSGFAPGVYLIKLENGKTYEFKKIVKE